MNHGCKWWAREGERGSVGEGGSGRKQKLELRSIMSSEMDLFSPHRCDCPCFCPLCNVDGHEGTATARPGCQQRRANPNRC